MFSFWKKDVLWISMLVYNVVFPQPCVRDTKSFLGLLNQFHFRESNALVLFSHILSFLSPSNPVMYNSKGGWTPKLFQWVLSFARWICGRLDPANDVWQAEKVGLQSTIALEVMIVMGILSKKLLTLWPGYLWLCLWGVCIRPVQRGEPDITLSKLRVRKMFYRVFFVLWSCSLAYHLWTC